MITIRPGNADDKNFIYATWLRSLYYGSQMRKIEQGAFFKAYPAVLDLLLKKPATVLVACLNEDPNVILGYAILEPEVLHWVYVKEAWRKQGIAKSLIGSSVLNSRTHDTDMVDKIKIIKDLTYNPFLI